MKFICVLLLQLFVLQSNCDDLTGVSQTCVTKPALKNRINNLTIPLSVYYNKKNTRATEKQIRTWLNRTENIFKYRALELDLHFDLRSFKYFDMLDVPTNSNNLTLDGFCKKTEVHESHLFSVLIDESKVYNGDTNFEEYWVRKVFVPRGSFCEPKYNCGVILGFIEDLNPYYLARLVALSMGVGIDGKETECSDDYFIMQAIQIGSEDSVWSSCSVERFFNYLRNNSACIKKTQNISNQNNQKILDSDKLVPKGPVGFSYEVDISAELKVKIAKG